ncbi:MAG: CpaF family protein [Ilumatobacteraceae bacterium]
MAEVEERWIATLRRQVADELGELVRRSTEDGRGAPDDTDLRQAAQAIIRRELRNRTERALQVGEALLSDAEEDEVLRDVLAAAFTTSPALDRLLERADVTDIHVNGWDDVRLVTVDGLVERADPIVGSDAELIGVIQALARRGGHMEREFTPAHPRLDLQLPDGSRLAAAAWVTARPYLTVRRHLLVDAAQEELVRRGMYDLGLASLLRAFVRARWNLLICGGQAVGKTTLLRALLHECGRAERLVVLEQEPELHLDRMPARHDQVLVFMERPANNEGAGAVTLADLSRTIKRFTPQRIVVGEVRGPEVIDMLEAMSQGITGSMCTLHADSSWSVFPRMAVYARAGGRDWATGDVMQLAALALNAIVFLTRDRNGRRIVAEIRHVAHYDPSAGQVVTDVWFRPDRDGRAAPNPTSPIPVDLLAELVAAGYDPALHDAGGL